jgi:hypothetical protein
MMAAALGLSTGLMAQKATKGSGKATSSTSSEVPKQLRVFLGRSDKSGGPISKMEFDRLLKQGLTAKDSLGNTYRVDGFSFSYAERNLYEDSVGNLMMLTDYLSEFCPGDTVSPAVSNNIYYKTKPGDTAYFEQVKVALPDGRKLPAKSMRFVLTK